MHGFPFAAAVQVRWCDLDAFDHVNNAVMVSYLEVARLELWRRRLAAAAGEPIPFVVARVTVEYRRPVRLDDAVEVGVGVTDTGGASFTLRYRVEAAGELAAEAETVQVVVDAATGRPRRLPPELRQALESVRLVG